MRVIIYILFLPLMLTLNAIGALCALTWIGINNGYVTVIEWASETK